MSNFETVVKDIDDLVGDFISKLTTKQLSLICVWAFVLIYMWARAFGMGLFFMDVIVFLWVAKNTYIFVKSVQELWRRVWSDKSKS